MIITFDIHGVLFTLDYKKIVRLLVRNISSFKLLAYLFNPRFIKTAFRLTKKGAIPEEYIHTLTASHKGLAPHKQLAIELANAQKPNRELFKLVEQLHKQGHELHIFSNIGDTLFVHLAAQHPTLFVYFDKICVPTAANNYLAKPHPLAFLHYLQRYNPKNKAVIFIDNRRHNIAMSQRHGMHGIHFTSLAQLEQQLAAILLMR